MKRLLLVACLTLLLAPVLGAQQLLIPMDLRQTDHLKAYGLVYWALGRGIDVDWLLNYRGGSFLLAAQPTVVAEARVRGILTESLDGASAARIFAEVQGADNNMDVVRLEKAPKIAVYVPANFQP